MKKKDIEKKPQEKNCTESKKGIGKLFSAFPKKSRSDLRNKDVKTTEENLKLETERDRKNCQIGDMIEYEVEKEAKADNVVEDTEVELELAPAEIQGKANFVDNLTVKISSVSQDVFKRIKKLCGEDDKYDVLTCRLLSYLNQCLNNGDIPDWNYIIQGDGEEVLLPVHERYKIYVLKHLLADGYIEGLAVKEGLEGKEIFEETSGIQITPLGKKYLKENNVMRKAFKIINDFIPLCNNALEIVEKKR